ncbi:MAG TPA: tetratricopeptide repeat protein, partial [Reyranella sp.]|nr:tetratricopeptide repeat protein [Reyranella sp.]
MAGAQTPPTRVQPVAAPTASPDVCYTGYGLTPKQKIQVCTDVIDSGAAKGPLAMGLAYFNRGVARSQDGDSRGSTSDYRTALRFYTDVIRSSAPSGQVVFQRGMIYHTMGDPDQAIVDYSDAIRLMPNDVQAYVNRGIVLYTKKDNNEGALADFNAAFKINRCEATAWINRGLVYKRKGDLSQSIADFTDAIKCLPANGPVVGSGTLDAAGKPFPPAHYQAIGKSTQLADAYYQRGLVYLDKGGKDRAQAVPMFNAAIKDFDEAIRINPTAAAHFVGRASTYMYKEMFREAIADFSQAIRLSPGDAYTYLHRGIAYHQVNEPDKAIDDYTEAHRINPLDVNPLVNRGIVWYSKKGQYDLAIKDFTDALKLDPKEINALLNRGIAWR